MDKSAIIVLLCVVGCFAEDLSLEIQGGMEQLVKAGETHKLVCSLHMGAIVLVNYKITWQHGDTLLSSDQELEPGTNTDQYGLSVKYEQPALLNLPTNITLTLKDVQASHEGVYTCKAVRRSDGVTVEKSVKVVVPRDVAGVSLTFENETVNDESAVGVQREEGEFSVSCSTDGFNPSASLTLSLGDRVVSRVQDNKDGDADEDQFKLKVMKRMKLSGDDTNKTLKCEAVASFDGAVSKVASLPLTIISLEPTIECDMTQIHEGDQYADFKCTVDHKLVKVKQFKWVMRNSGKVFSPSQYDEKHKVTVEEVETGVSVVKLHLIGPEERHFSEEYLIYVELDNGQRFEQMTNLFSLGKATSGSSQMAASLFTFLLAIFLNL